MPKHKKYFSKNIILRLFYGGVKNKKGLLFYKPVMECGYRELNPDFELGKLTS